MNKKTKLGLLSTAFVTVLGLTAVFTGAKNHNLVNADENYRIVLNADNTPTIDDKNMAMEATSRYVNLMYQGVEEAENAHVALLPGGLIANDGQGDHRFSGVKNITVVTDGIINLYGAHPTGRFDLLHTFTSEAPVYEKAINYFNLAFANADINFDGKSKPEVTPHETKAVVTSLVIEYSCVDTSSITFGGTVVSAAGPVSGATVSITGTDLTAVTGADGKYVFEDVFVPTFDFEVVATCPAYFEARATVNSLVTTKDLELIRHPYSDGNFVSADHKARPFFTRSTTALMFDILDGAGLTDDREYSIFITLDGNNDTSRVGSKVLEFRFKTNNWIGVWDYSTSTWATWTPDVALSFNADKTNARVTVTYNYINGINGYNIEPTEKVGVTFGAWVTSTLVWEGWKEGAWYADPLNPSVYLKIDANNGEHVAW